MTAGGFLFLLGCIVQRKPPEVPGLFQGLSCSVLLLGWLMTLNPKSVFLAESSRFIPIAAKFPILPGSVDATTSAAWMWRITGLIAMGWVACDLSRDTKWRRRLIVAIAASGVTIVLFGLLQRVGAVPSLFPTDGPAGERFFATFYYHANAGAFINLTFPPVAALAVLSAQAFGASVSRAIWISSLLLFLAAMCINVSKAAMLVSGMEVLVFAAWWAWCARKTRGPVGSGVSPASLVVVLVAGLLVAWFVGWAPAMRRWEGFLGQIGPGNTRWLVAGVTFEMAKEGGVWGFGPGTFEIVFPHFSQGLGDRAPGIWKYAHQDYFQTASEWGWAGFVLWTGLYIGGMAGWAREALKSFVHERMEGMFISFACFLSLIGIALHAMVDFPFQIASLQLYAIVLVGAGWQGWSTSPHDGRGAPTYPTRES
jgi:hypothetical protein